MLILVLLVLVMGLWVWRRQERLWLWLWWLQWWGQLRLRRVVGLGRGTGICGLGGGDGAITASRVHVRCIESSYPLWGFGTRSDRVLGVGTRRSDRSGPRWGT